MRALRVRRRCLGKPSPPTLDASNEDANGGQDTRGPTQDRLPGHGFGWLDAILRARPIASPNPSAKMRPSTAQSMRLDTCEVASRSWATANGWLRLKLGRLPPFGGPARVGTLRVSFSRPPWG